MLISAADEAKVRPVTVLDVTDFAVGYGASMVVEHVTIGVGRSELVAVIGPNGSGKSTRRSRQPRRRRRHGDAR
jgi:ABC-type transporter Mla maintaining outer membrane lipid asymmetry ATPase subunit MlaF